MSKVIVLQHTPAETLGTIADSLNSKGIQAEYVRPFLGEAVPKAMNEAAGLVAMGGPMGVADRDREPFLKEELLLIEQALKAGRPILGICLGSQLLAHALGARVYRGPQKEIGWHRVRLTEEGMTDPLWKGVEKSFFAYHWHGDVFDLPKGSVCLASSDQTPRQAFRHGHNAYGLLFHLEVTDHLIREMIRAFSDELAEEKLDGGHILEKGVEHLLPLERVSHAVFSRWADLL